MMLLIAIDKDKQLIYNTDGIFLILNKYIVSKIF
jgi:hypothetical protein